uniref:GATA zinc finger domain-containing protein 4-like n=1 Tax=Dermatophagoides pteronyssinus TaxID=6956 RepID=A0A6P6Y0J6_DERPT|nr:GATA zinc finger domain-containing protein 4-like [Dermatophagoides pteronyssinus]
MILWIALGCETGRQIDEVNQKLGRSRGDERRFLMQLNQAAVVPLFTRSSLPRVYLLTILNSLINEFIALACLISYILRARQIFVITESLLTLIWFIEQYRLDDFYHHIDSLDWQSSRLNVTTHVIHLIVITIGFFCWLTDQSSHGHMRTIRDNSSIMNDNEKNIRTGTGDIRSLKKDGNNSAREGHHEGESSLVSGIIQSRFKRHCDWMRDRFLYNNNNLNKICKVNRKKSMISEISNSIGVHNKNNYRKNRKEINEKDNTNSWNGSEKSRKNIMTMLLTMTNNCTGNGCLKHQNPCNLEPETSIENHPKPDDFQETNQNQTSSMNDNETIVEISS